MSDDIELPYGPLHFVSAIEADELRAERDEAIRERDELLDASPDADVFYWKNRTLDHATALDKARAERDELREALSELVMLKDGPRDVEYERRKPLAWQAARATLAHFNPGERV